MNPTTHRPLVPLRQASALAVVACLCFPALAQNPTSGAHQPSAADLRYLHSLPVPTATIADVVVNLNGVATDIGDIDVTAAPNAANTRTIMDATFRLAPAHARLKNWVTFHWVQAITADACPVPYFGRILPFPQMDPPRGGWDYMYLDGGARTAPDLRIPDFGWFLDDQPWYWNATGEGAMSTPGLTYTVQDAPFHCTTGGATTFTTWLVAETPGQSLCLIRGFQWTISNVAARRAGPTDEGAPAAAHAATIAAALANGGFAGWTVGAGCRHDYGLDAFVSVDPSARTIGFTLQVVGPPLGLGAIWLAGSVNPPLALPIGLLYLDPAWLAQLAVVPLNAAGFGELRPSVPAATYPDFALQAAVTDGLTAQLTNFAMLGTYANALKTEIFAARYDGARDVFSVLGKGNPGDRIEVTVQNPAQLPRPLGSFTVPPAPTMIAFTHLDPVFRPGGVCEVWNRTSGARLIRMQ